MSESFTAHRASHGVPRAALLAQLPLTRAHGSRVITGTEASLTGGILHTPLPPVVESIQPHTHMAQPSGNEGTVETPTLIERVQNIAAHYGEAITWGMSYSSKEDSWSVAFYGTDDEGDKERGAFLIFSNRSEPIFAMRCENLTVVVEALEHWHAGVLQRDPK